MTNAEKIRNMTVEQLAKMIVRGSICDMCSINCESYKAPEYCELNVCEWLKEEVQNER